ncbi:MAG: MFS transporter, partial [Burkholderiales bacterium]|nr:MFS transporter [Burkholderiales bacterium]
MSAARDAGRVPAAVSSGLLTRRAGIVVFLAFAAAYFCSTLVRAITATLSPVLTQEFSLHARDLGLLAGGYFLGFAAMQLPLGAWLDRYGPKRVILCFLALAVLACLAFAAATSFVWLLLARVLMGMGVSACLMAPLTGYRRWFDVSTLLRTNSWMLMTGSLGMLASTLPVQWLMPLTGWRPLFWMLAALVGLSMALIAWVVPAWWTHADVGGSVIRKAASVGATSIWRNRYFRKMSPVAFFNYGGVIAIQTLWAGPWMLKVADYTPLEAATGLFWINASMLVTFWAWGLVNPWLSQHGWRVDRLITWGVPISMTVLAVNIAAGPATGWVGWALFCMASSVLGLA